MNEKLDTVDSFEKNKKTKKRKPRNVDEKLLIVLSCEKLK